MGLIAGKLLQRRNHRTTASPNKDPHDEHHNRKTTRRILIAAPLIGLAVLGVGVGLAHAGTLPTSGSTVAMTIRNDTDQVMTLNANVTTSGDFIAAPQATLAPHSSEIVTASSTNHDGFATVVNYSLTPKTDVTFEANNLPSGANTVGTVINDPAHYFTTSSSMDSGHPAMNASYSVHPIVH